MSAHIHRGVVYFAVAGRYVKIGYCSGDLDRRLAVMCKGRLARPADLDAGPVRLLHLIPGCIQRDERRIHGLFASHRDVGEWFRLTPAFLLQLAALEYVTDAETLARFRAARRELKRSRIAFLGAAA